MFETVAPGASHRNRLVFYETLPVSIAVHAILAGVAAFLIVNRLQFPIDPPRLLVAYAAMELTPPPPPPPPPPPAGATNAAASPTSLPITFAHIEELAPTIIPQTVAELPAMQPRAQLVSLSLSAGPPSAVPGGVPGGVAGGVIGGTVGGDKHGTIGGVLGDDGRLYFRRDADLPLLAESRPYPEYPPKQRNLAREDTVVVRYVIGRDGRVFDVRTSRKPVHEEFEEAALTAVRQWKFRPLMVDGEPIEVVHEVTVYFRLY